MRRVRIFRHNNTTRDRRLAGRPPTIEFQHRSDSQSLGTGCGIRRQILFFNAHVSSINPFSLSTYFCYPKGIHPKATLCIQMLLHHWVCQSLVTNQPLTFTLSSASWTIQPNTANLIITQQLLNLQNPQLRRSKVKRKEAICDAIILLFLNHARFKGPYNALHSYPLFTQKEIIGCLRCEDSIYLKRMSQSDQFSLLKSRSKLRWM